MALEFIKTGALGAAAYADRLEVVVSDPLLAALPDGDPLKVSKKMPLGSIPTKFVDWDVTPTVEIGETVLAVSEPYHMDIGPNGDLSVNYAGAPVFTNGSPPTFWGGAVRTNVDLSTLTADVAIHLGYEITSVVPSYAPFLMGFVLGDPNKTPTDIVDGILAELGAGTADPITHASILSLVLVYGAQKQTNISWTIPNDVNPLFPDAGGMLHVKNQPLLATLDFGSKVIMAIGRDASGISIANINIAPNGATYDITDAAAVIDNPVLPADTALFYFIVGLDFGQGYPVISIKPTVTAAPPSYDVTGTTYNAVHGGTNGTWAALFPNPITTPISTIVTQAVFPVTATVGRGLNAIIAPSYTDPYPAAPYGITVTNGTKCIVDNITPGDEDFTPLVSSGELAVINNAILSNQTQLTALNLSVAAAAKNSTMGEIIIYVRASTQDSSETPIPTGPTVFDTFDLAYTFATGLPKYLRKRIVLDDRVNATFRGIEQAAVDNNSPTTFKVYALLANSITLSSYSVYSAPPVGLPSSPRLTLLFACDGLRLEDFSGYSGTLVDSFGGQHPMFDIISSVSGPNGVVFEDNLIIGRNSFLYSTSADIGIEQGGTVIIDNDGHWSIYAYAINQSQFNQSVIIAKARYGKLTVMGAVELLAYDGSTSFTVIMEHGGTIPTVQLSDPNALYISYTDALAPVRFTYGNYVVVETVGDLIRVNEFNGGGSSGTELNISNQYSYFVVGDVDLGSLVLNIFNDTNNRPIKFIGLPGSKLTSAGTVFQGIYPPPIYNPILEIIGVDVATTNPSIPAVYIFGSLVLNGSTVYSNRAIGVLDVPGYLNHHNVEIRDAVFLSSGGGFIDTMGIIDVRGRVTIDGVYAKVNTGVQLFSIDIKPVSNPYGLEAIPNNQCNIDNVTVLFSEQVSLSSRVFDLGRYRTATTGYNGIYMPGQISVNNVTVQYVGGNQNGRYELFCREGVVYNHQLDEAIWVDGVHSFAYLNGSGGYYNGLGASEQVYQFLDPVMLRGFELTGTPSNTIKYIGKTSKVFELTVDHVASASANSVVLSMSVRQNSTNVNHGSVQTTMETSNQRYRDGIVIPLLLAPEDNVSLAFSTSVNCNLSFGNFRISLKEA